MALVFYLTLDCRAGSASAFTKFCSVEEAPNACTHSCAQQLAAPAPGSGTHHANRCGVIIVLSGKVSLDQGRSRHPRNQVPWQTNSDSQLLFEPNAGQTAPPVSFTASSAGGRLFFTPREVVLSLVAGEDVSTTDPRSTAVRAGRY